MRKGLSKTGLLALLVLIASLSLTFIGSVAAPAGVIQVGLCLDGSNSLTDSEWTIIVDGVADAIEINLPHDGSFELTVVQFGYWDVVYGYNVSVEVSPTIITSANYASIATQIRGLTQGKGWTPMADGLLLTWDTMKNSPNFASALKQLINIATDGVPTDQLWLTPPIAWGTPPGDPKDDVSWVRDHAAAEGLDELDAEAIDIATSDLNWMRDNVVWPQPGHAYVTPPATYVPGWVEWVADATALANALASKFELIKVSPIAVIDEDKHTVNIGESINFDGSGSYDPDGGSIVLYEWDFESDGTYDATGMTTSHAYGAAGTYIVTLRVTDDEGQIGTTSESKVVKEIMGVPEFGLSLTSVISLLAALYLFIKRRKTA